MIYFICAVIICIIAVFLESFRELNSLRVTKYQASSTKLEGKYTIVFISDYHEAKRLNDRIIAAIDNISPDLVLIGGDMLNGKSLDEDIEPVVQLINQISEKYDTYMAYGNHERKIKDDYYGTGGLWQAFESEVSDKLHFLVDEHIDINNDICIYGLDIPPEYYHRLKYPELRAGDITEDLGAPGERYNILLAHTPDFIDGYSEWGADLVLAGHFHGGMIRLPFIGGVISPRLRLFPGYDYGAYSVGHTMMLVTNGLGQHSMKIRINNIPEIVCIELSKG